MTKTREEELKKRAYQTLNQKDYGEWCFAEGRRLQKIEDDKKGYAKALADVERIIYEKREKEKRLFKATKLKEYNFAVIVLDNIKQSIKELGK